MLATSSQPPQPPQPPQLPRRTAPTLSLLAAIVVGFVPGCTRSVMLDEVEPEALPASAQQEDPPNASGASAKPVVKRPREPVESFLESRFPGVLVSTNPDGSLRIRIRGAASFLGGSDPLYVIDGSPVRPELGGALIGVNPYDIESIRVLKGPPETSLYGVRGANGVVIITTRRP